MRLIRTPEQQELGQSVQAFLARTSPMSRVREIAEAPETSYDRKVWERMSGELGLTGLAIPEAYGGAGYGRGEVAVVMEELGAALTPSPYFASVMAAEALVQLEDQAAAEEFLPAIAAGTTVAALHLPEARLLSVAQVNGGYELTGRAERVMYGAEADLVLVVGRLDDRPAVFAVTEGFTRTPLTTLDLTRPQAHLDFAGTPARLIGPADATDALARTLDQASVALAAGQLGGIRRCLDTIVEYAKLRVQFGRYIGSFQGVKHQLADLHCTLEQAESIARYAAWAADEAPAELPVAAAMSQSFLGPAYFQVAKAHLLLHGGIGFTWEHDAHFYYKRAKSDQVLLGAPRRHRALLAERLGLCPG
jgi:acyl-CoA dehydrogenase